MDNVSVEKLWTWRLQYIVSTGIKTRKTLYYKLAQQIPSILVTWLFIIWQIYEAVWILYTLLFILLFIIHLLVIRYFNKFTLSRRKQRIEIEKEHSRQLIKLLMSKMEIVQSNKEYIEIQQSNKILWEAIPVNKNVSFYLNAMAQTSRTFVWLLNMFIIAYWMILVKNWWDLSIFVWLVICSTL